ncbi:MAG TPA: YciI family protein [Gemmatimonadaceae bacterium]|nr:YciI family protein [Gemmatimonadaceae bacterium]
MGAAGSYLLIFRETSLASYDALSPDERRQAMGRWNGWCDELAAEGRFLGGHPLEPAGRIVSAARRGQAARHARPIDGPFAEAKELIGGYFLLSAASLDEATAIAERCPFLQYGMTVEVRPVTGACHLARSLGWETMREPASA